MQNKKIIDQLQKLVDEHTLLIGSILIIIPALLCLLFIWKYGFNVIYWDEWEYILFIKKAFLGQATFTDLFSQHNESRIIFPRLIYLANAVIFHYKTKYMAYLSWLLLAVILLVLYKTFKGYDKNNRYAAIQFVPVAFLLFTFNQWESILYGQTICSYLSAFSFIAAMYLLNKLERPGPLFILAMVCGTVSTYSYSSGLLVWPLGLLFIILFKKQYRPLLAGCWALAGAIELAAYFYGFQFNPAHPSVLYALRNPFNGFAFLLVNVGEALASNVYDGLAIGCIVLALLALMLYVVARMGLLQKYSLLLILILYSLGTTGMLVIGRSGFGVGAGLTSRYVHMTVFTVIGLYLIVIDLYNSKTKYQKLIKSMLAILIILIAYGVIVGYTVGLQKGVKLKQTSDEDRIILLNYKSMPDSQLKKLYPIPDALRERAEFVEEYRLNVFYDTA